MHQTPDASVALIWVVNKFGNVLRVSTVAVIIVLLRQTQICAPFAVLKMIWPIILLFSHTLTKVNSTRATGGGLIVSSVNGTFGALTYFVLHFNSTEF